MAPINTDLSAEQQEPGRRNIALVASGVNGLAIDTRQPVQITIFRRHPDVKAEVPRRRAPRQAIGVRRVWIVRRELKRLDRRHLNAVIRRHRAAFANRTKNAVVERGVEGCRLVAIFVHV